ncbi:unnamed protein product [Miscanthus lutarioriparius]|uniref:AMP-dependent synthetase/ligase domain-containing protein n=1 Tax=Miscanthus lutarioriparius TaxID=422564 RepID=A0A811P316_9POAL|nr:unnamed protein product [Miscanthus lutarioriparius]
MVVRWLQIAMLVSAIGRCWSDQLWSSQEVPHEQDARLTASYRWKGANAVEFIMDHAEISIALVQESKIKSILAVVPKCTAHLRAIVSFGDFTSEMKTEAEKFGVSCFSWEEFSSMIKEGLGGRIRLMTAGPAPLPGQIEEFMRVTSCSIVVQGYGLTESCAGCFTSIANVFSMIGTVGPPVTTIEARLESVPEMGYDALSDMPLLCPSPDLLIS